MLLTKLEECFHFRVQMTCPTPSRFSLPFFKFFCFIFAGVNFVEIRIKGGALPSGVGIGGEINGRKKETYVKL